LIHCTHDFSNQFSFAEPKNKKREVGKKQKNCSSDWKTTGVPISHMERFCMNAGRVIGKKQKKREKEAQGRLRWGAQQT